MNCPRCKKDFLFKNPSIFKWFESVHFDYLKNCSFTCPDSDSVWNDRAGALANDIKPKTLNMPI